MSLTIDIIAQELTRQLNLNSYLALRTVSKYYSLALPLPDNFTVLVEYWDGEGDGVAVVTLCLGACGVILPSYHILEEAAMRLEDWNVFYHRWYDNVPRQDALRVYHGLCDFVLNAEFNLCISDDEREGKVANVRAVVGPLRREETIEDNLEEVSTAIIRYLISDVSYEPEEDSCNAYLSLDKEGKCSSLHLRDLDDDWVVHHWDFPEHSPTLFVSLNIEVDYWLLKTLRRTGIEPFESVLLIILGYVNQEMRRLNLPFARKDTV